MFECVSSRARRAIGISDDVCGGGEEENGVDVKVGMKGPWLLIRNMNEQVLKVPSSSMERGDSDTEDVDGKNRRLRLPVRQWHTITDVVWDPPEWNVREIIR